MTRVSVPVELRWFDLDAYQHVNNVQFLRILEEARVRAFWRGYGGGGELAVIDAQPGSHTMTLIASQQIEYLAPMPYFSEPADVQVWLGRLGGASMDVCYEVCSTAGAEPHVVYAKAVTTIVFVDAATSKPRRLTEEERTAYAPYVEEPVKFRR